VVSSRKIIHQQTQTFDELDVEETLASLAGETTASSEAVSGVV
jgi:hypothetical protein